MPAKARWKWEGCLRGPARERGWALCVGAGSSFDLFPSWQEFTSRLMGAGGASANGMAERFGLEAVVQAVKNRYAGRSGEFLRRAKLALYGSLLKALNERERALVLRALCAGTPAQMPQREWRAYLDTVHARFKPTTAEAMAEVVVRLLDRGPAWTAPTEILSFNMEPFFYSVINAHWRSAGRRSQLLLDPVTRSLSFRRSARIPYYFCHGLLPPPDAPRQFGQITDPSKLVFAEDEYQAVASNSFAWSSVMFLHTVLIRSVVFVGLSFSDPDLRRWLTWAEANRSRESGGRAGPRHFWIEQRPRSETERAWLEHSTRHLGVEMIWLHDWSALGPCLRAMLGA
jgi:hypothetical protein